MTKRTVRAALGCLALMVGLSGCSWTGINSVSLPFTKGRGDDSLTITVQLENAANLVPNSEVKYDEVTIGSVRKIELEDWVATLTIGLEEGSHVPADVVASVAQKSLLGAEYLELKDPATRDGQGATDVLATGDVIALDRTRRYPETEEVLTAASMLLNGGGLPQIQTIAKELNAALGGRTDDIKSFMRTVSTFTDRLDGQRDNIASVLTQMNRLSKAVTGDKGKVTRILQEIPEGLQVLEDERAELVRALRAVAGFGTTAHEVIGDTKVAFQENLAHLRRITKTLADHGDKLAKSVDGVTYPFNMRDAGNVIYGDYMNLITEIEVSAQDLTNHWLGGTPLDGLLPALLGGSPTGPAADASDPLAEDPLDGLLGTVEGILPDLTGSASSGKDARSSGSSGTSGNGTPTPSPGGKDVLSSLLNGLLGGGR
jgi:phospholipid/cholesterol/gamma-HCH transport system substrate-binding protein